MCRSPEMVLVEVVIVLVEPVRVLVKVDRVLVKCRESVNRRLEIVV